MRNVCRFFIEGKCKFGSKCKYDHVRYTSLVDPPQWIYSSYRGLDLMEISPEEVRFALMCGDMKEVLDNFWIGNYMALCGEMDLLESDARIASVSNRHVDPRENPDVFMAPFDVDRVSGTIRQMRAQGARPLEKRQGDTRRGDGGWGSTSLGSPRPHPTGDGGYKDKRYGWSRQESGAGSAWFQGNKAGDRAGHGGYRSGYGGEPRGFPREPSYPKGNDSEYRQKGSWGYGKGTSKKYSKPEDEFDIQDTPSSFPGAYSGGTPRAGGAWTHNSEALGDRQNASRGSGDEEFIEEDFEYGRVPYNYRKPSK
ncbi:hypothetical protein [Encephalitozoon cuniculi GB-M1]|uniref:C3H1-type domain-containing protein n=1 Tax=Encephalitozoon cuniculi (strain GB-M1) TaxID=284813 RepID=Q8SUK9_ENCCU|nr:uncharacterized protein ECU08_1630 [Encephalitozoon cuniculi GB-M1]KMV65690.1 cleavage and polyadenylation specificity factorsubunit Clipper-like protein [Encephalitozoon cuniculi EcunIII-L]UYI27096.1 hypothetical protein J0A71_04g09460 [Encephalitozoon cuniculi]CAD26467.1 hypothetical protein [Encephalitozoon cuniculi GB-M1]